LTNTHVQKFVVAAADVWQFERLIVNIVSYTLKLKDQRIHGVVKVIKVTRTSEAVVVVQELLLPCHWSFAKVLHVISGSIGHESNDLTREGFHAISTNCSNLTKRDLLSIAVKRINFFKSLRSDVTSISCDEDDVSFSIKLLPPISTVKG
jgi:hypothetical protein